MGRLGYMENAYGPLVGNGGGVTCMKDVGYVTICDDEDAIRRMSENGFKYFEVLEDNLLKFEDRPDEFKAICEKYGMQLISVCSGFHFIYEEAREEELYKAERECRLMQEFGAKYMVLCGGSIHGTGRREEDYAKLAKGVDAVAEVCSRYGITACYHPHLGALAEGPDQIDKLFALSGVAFCPDIAHLKAGGSDPLKMIEKYYDRIPFIHLKDLSDEGEFYPLGKGTIGDINAKVIDFMKEKGYTGDWLVECDGYSGDPDEACAASFDFLKGKLNEKEEGEKI